MKKYLQLTLSAIFFSFTTFAIGPISGSHTCLGTTGHVTDSLSSGGVWSSSNTAVATVTSATGYVYGIAVGTTTITYTLGGAFVTKLYTIDPPGPAPIITPITTAVCVGTNISLSDASPGGTWSSSNQSIATVDSFTGLITSVNAGSVVIVYSTSCAVYQSVTFNGGPAPFITGPTDVCVGAAIICTADTLTGPDTTSISGGGTWSSTNTTVATVNASTGVVTGISAGTTTISYALTGVCGTGYASTVIHVSNTTSPGTISGASTIIAGLTTTLLETQPGTWSSDNTTVATVGTTTGIVSGVSAGTAVITFTVNGCGGIAVTTHTITAVQFAGISGNVNFPGVAYNGYVKVWLITYNPATLDLEAVDSVSVYASGSSAYYQFQNIVTDSYRVKAYAYDMDFSGPDTVILSTGYIPTYHTSSLYWYSADVINHNAAAADINEDINLLFGTLTSGSGFIGGNVTAGANRGTARTTTIPVSGLNVYLLNSSNQLLQFSRTDINGNYSFSNLPVGTYYVFPDSLNYMTTAFTGINITAGTTSVTAANFTQHTIAKTITPNTTAISNIGSTMASVIAFPNPTNGKLNLQWNENTTENAQVTISDITGRQVYQAAMKMNAGSGVKQIDLSALVNGLYIISVKSADISYTSKVQVQK